MAVLSDYIKWRGDLEFWQDGFNDFDNLVLSAISYVDLGGIFAAADAEVLTIEYLCHEYFEGSDDLKPYREGVFLKTIAEVLKLAGSTRRYSRILVRNFENHIDTEMTVQFSAMEFLLPDGTSYIAFRGTDDTIVGWKEDFMMAITETEAELEAAAFINTTQKNEKRLLRIGGHSKGGHLAVYAAACCDPSIQERILRVYSNDGPGFSKEFVKSKGARAIEKKITRIIPEESIVGTLMEPLGRAIIVKSTNKGAYAHEIRSWCLDYMEFDEAAGLTKSAKAVSKATKEWLDSFSLEERRAFVDDLFSVLEASGADTLTGIKKGGLNSISLMTRRLNALSPETKDHVNKLIRMYLSDLF